MKRFYKTAAAARADDGWMVELDGKPMRTPGRAAVVVPNQRLAAAMAEEWQAQPAEGDIQPLQMPLTRLAVTAIDNVAPQRAKVAGEAAAYAASDLLCYRVDTPPELVARQQAIWQPVLDWLAAAYDAPLATTTGIVRIPQDPVALAALSAAVGRYADFGLCALANLTFATGSLALALALADGHLDAEAGWRAAELDALFQIEKWGEDHEAAKRRENLRRDIAAATRFLDLLGPARFASRA
jgi:chaperone required for assembly of F1-ATPase